MASFKQIVEAFNVKDSRAEMNQIMADKNMNLEEKELHLVGIRGILIEHLKTKGFKITTNKT